MKRFGTNVAKVSSLLGIFLVGWIIKVAIYIYIYMMYIYLFEIHMFFKIFVKWKTFLCMLQMTPLLISLFKPMTSFLILLYTIISMATRQQWVGAAAGAWDDRNAWKVPFSWTLCRFLQHRINSKESVAFLRRRLTWLLECVHFSDSFSILRYLSCLHPCPPRPK